MHSPQVVAVVVLLAAGPGCVGAGTGATGTGGTGSGSTEGDGTQGTDDGSGGDAGYIFDQGELRTYEVEVAQEDLQWLDDNAILEQYVPATLRFEGDEYGPIGLRYKGGATLSTCVDDQGKKTCDRMSMKLKFSEYDDNLRFFGLKRLNFHAMSQDPSLLRERIAYGLFRDFGVPAPRTVHARLVINGELEGLFALVEQIDGSFTRSRYAEGGRGNLYKEVWPIHFDEAPYLEALKTNREENPSAAKMVAFALALEEAGDDGFLDVIDVWADRDHVARYLAVDRTIDNWDGIMGMWCYMEWCGNHNYYWYEETDADRVHLIPWDLDHTLAYPNFFQTEFGLPAWNEDPGICEPIVVWGEYARRGARCDEIADRMVGQMWPEYVVASTELLDTLFTAEAVSASIDTWMEQIEPAVAEDPHLPGGLDWEAAVGEVRGSIPALRNMVLETIGG